MRGMAAIKVEVLLLNCMCNMHLGADSGPNKMEVNI